MEKFDYFYSLCVGKFLNGTEWLLKAFVPTHTKGVNKKLNINYGDHKNQRLDIFYSQNPSQNKKPIFFYIHGGGFVSGKIELRRNYCCRLAREGFFVVNLDYRPAPKVQFRDAFSDIFKAIDFVFDSSEKYNLDTNKIVVGGESAGAYFSTYIAAMTKQKQLYEQFNADFRHKNDFLVDSLVLINGAYNIEDIVKAKAPFKKTFVKAFFNLTNNDLKCKDIAQKKQFSPLNYIESNFPKSVVIQGKYDVFGMGTKSLIKTFDEKSVDYSLLVAKGIAGCHAVSIVPVSKNAICVQKQTIKIIKDFLCKKEMTKDDNNGLSVDNKVLE